MALNRRTGARPTTRNDASFIENLLPVAVEKKMGIIGMRSRPAGECSREGGFGSIEQSLNYVLSLPISTVVVGSPSWTT